MEVRVEFENSLSCTNSIIERFMVDYPNAKHEVVTEDNDNYGIIVIKNDEWESIDDVDTFLCEEICHEYDSHCHIIVENNRMSYYYDEEDEWFPR